MTQELASARYVDQALDSDAGGVRVAVRLGSHSDVYESSSTVAVTSSAAGPAAVRSHRARAVLLSRGAPRTSDAYELAHSMDLEKSASEVRNWRAARRAAAGWMAGAGVTRAGCGAGAGLARARTALVSAVRRVVVVCILAVVGLCGVVG